MQLDIPFVVRIVKEVLKALPQEGLQDADPSRVVAGVSNRHVHLSQADLEVLFGPGHELTRLRDLRQPGQYACEETVTVVTSGGVLEKVRVLGPVRERSQFELAASDARKLRINPPLARSGSGGACPSVLLVGPAGSVHLFEGIGLAWRHVHLSPSEAVLLGLEDGTEVDVEIAGDRGLVFRRVWVRVREGFLSEFHVDLDEANACGLKTGDMVRVMVPER